MNIHDILNGIEYLNKYLNEYSFINHKFIIWFSRVELLFRCSFRVSDSDPG